MEVSAGQRAHGLTPRDRIHRLDSVESTLDEIHRLAEEERPDGTVVVAREQTAGRGSRGRDWHSPPGGLWFSMLQRGSAAQGSSVLSLRVGLAVALVIDRLGIRHPVTLKWPNDVMWCNRKLGGILCEARWLGGQREWVAIGIGINVTNPLPDEVKRTAIRLDDLLPRVMPEDLVEPLAVRIRALSELGPGLSPQELGSYTTRDWLLGRTLLEPLPGIARGVTREGELLVETQAGVLKAVRSGHVVLAEKA